MTRSVPAGWTETTIRNQGSEEHQAQVARINDGVTFHLKSGAYLAVCFLNDAAKGGLPQALEEMIQPFTIRIP